MQRVEGEGGRKKGSEKMGGRRKEGEKVGDGVVGDSGWRRMTARRRLAET
jgi:hypothetical protein